MFAVLALGIFLATIVSADTTIANFAAGEQVSVPVIPEISTWPTLNSTSIESRYSLSPAPYGSLFQTLCETEPSGTCPYELWVVLDLDTPKWQRHTQFQLRVSSHPSFPTDFSIQILNSSVMSARWSAEGKALIEPHASKPTTRIKYARLRLVDKGFRKPDEDGKRLPPLDSVTFDLLLEPMYFGILPATVVPVIISLLPVMILALLALTPVKDLLDWLAGTAISQSAQADNKEGASASSAAGKTGDERKNETRKNR